MIRSESGRRTYTMSRMPFRQIPAKMHNVGIEPGTYACKGKVLTTRPILLHAIILARSSTKGPNCRPNKRINKQLNENAREKSPAANITAADILRGISRNNTLRENHLNRITK